MGNSRLIIAVLAASILSSLITAVVLRPGTTNAPPSNTEQETDWSELNSNLKDLVRALQPRSVSRPVDATETMPRTSIEEPIALQAIARRLEDLTGLVASQSWQGSSQAMALAEEGPRYLVTQWPAIEELYQRVEADRGAVSQQHFFLTPTTILQRYGRPSRIRASNNGFSWYYDNGQGGDARVAVVLSFVDGYVISAGTWVQPRQIDRE